MLYQHYGDGAHYVRQSEEQWWDGIPYPTADDGDDPEYLTIWVLGDVRCRASGPLPRPSSLEEVEQIAEDEASWHSDDPLAIAVTQLIDQAYNIQFDAVARAMGAPALLPTGVLR